MIDQHTADVVTRCRALVAEMQALTTALDELLVGPTLSDEGTFADPLAKLGHLVSRVVGGNRVSLSPGFTTRLELESLEAYRNDGMMQYSDFGWIDSDEDYIGSLYLEEPYNPDREVLRYAYSVVFLVEECIRRGLFSTDDLEALQSFMRPEVGEASADSLEGLKSDAKGLGEDSLVVGSTGVKRKASRAGNVEELPEVLTTSEQVCLLLGIGKTKLVELRKLEGFPASQVSDRKYLYRKSELLEWAKGWKKGKHTKPRE